MVDDIKNKLLTDEELDAEIEKARQKEEQEYIARVEAFTYLHLESLLNKHKNNPHRAHAELCKMIAKANL